MNISTGLPSTYQKIYEQDPLRVIAHKSGEEFVVYNFQVLPPGATVLSDVRYPRYGQRFATRSAAEKAFNSLKNTTSIVNLKSNQLI
jgi:hypothetical protein